MQGEFDFLPSFGEDGYRTWKEARKTAEQALARELGLPIGHKCEVWLTNGMQLAGLLRLREDQLMMVEKQSTAEFEIDGVPFRYGDLERCVRLDG